MTALPDGWRNVALADVADTALGKMLDKARPKGSITVPYLRNVNVQWGRIDTHDVLSVDLNQDERDRFALAPGDLLVCEGGDIGRAAIWRGGRAYMAYQKALHRVRSRGDVDLRWLRYLLEHYALTGVLADRATGSTILHLPQQELRRLPVPLPPLSEQQRIVEILEDHLSRLDAAAAIVRSSETLAHAWLRSAIDGIVWRERDGGRVAVADLLAEKMRNGHSARASMTGAGVRALTLTAVTRNNFTDAFTKIVTVEEERVRDLWLRDGDILVQRSNTPELVGTTAIYRGPDNWAIFPDLLIRLRAHESRVSADYLAAAMRTERAHRRLRTRAKGLAGSMPKIDQAAIGSLVIPVPSGAAQNEVVTRVAEIEDAHTRLLSGTQTTRRRIASLRRALLDAAFSGRLIGQATVANLAQELAHV